MAKHILRRLRIRIPHLLRQLLGPRRHRALLLQPLPLRLLARSLRPHLRFAQGLPRPNRGPHRRGPRHRRRHSRRHLSSTRKLRRRRRLPRQPLLLLRNVGKLRHLLHRLPCLIHLLLLLL